jgi:hypothetical protein
LEERAEQSLPGSEGDRGVEEGIREMTQTMYIPINV